MFKNYESFIQDFDSILKILFGLQNKYICCKKGCTKCCKKGNYPLSQTEFAYLTQGFINLNDYKKQIVQKNINDLLLEKSDNKNGGFEHKCPFLTDDECCVYKYRPIICRTFGICYYDDKEGYVRLPECVYDGLNYSEYYDKKERILKINDVPMVNLRIDRVLNSELAKKYEIFCGEIKPMLDWLDN